MSSTTGRSTDRKSGSAYAPKWARDSNVDPNSVRRRQAARSPWHAVDSAAAPPTAPADSLTYGNDDYPFQLPPSLEPILMPLPPLPERSGARSALIPLLFALFLAGLTASVIVAEWPKIQSFVSGKSSADNLFGARFDGYPPRTLTKLPDTASRGTTAGTVIADNQPSSSGRQATARDASGSAPSSVLPSPVAKPPAATSEPANAAATAISVRESPTPAAPSTGANVVPTESSAPALNVKTISTQPKKPIRPLGRDEIQMLLKQADDFVSIGDFASARTVFGRVYEAREALGALGYASTYDPIFLAKIGAKGSTPDVAKAREWYAKARDLGSTTAGARLEALAGAAQ